LGQVNQFSILLPSWYAPAVFSVRLYRAFVQRNEPPELDQEMLFLPKDTKSYLGSQCPWKLYRSWRRLQKYLSLFHKLLKKRTGRGGGDREKVSFLPIEQLFSSPQWGGSLNSQRAVHGLRAYLPGKADLILYCFSRVIFSSCYQRRH